MKPTSRRPSASSRKPAPPFTADDLVSALAETMRGQTAEGFAAADLERETGWRRSKINEALRRAFTLGLVECVGRQYRPAIDGAPRPVPVYRLRGAA